MLNYLIRRILIGLFTLLLITFLIYGLIRNMPGDPTTLMRAEADPSKKVDLREWERNRKLYGLDKPWPIGYAQWLGNVVFRFDLGRSIVHKVSVVSLIQRALGPTLLLSIPSIILAYVISIPIGLWSTVRSGRPDERAMGVFLYMLYSLPSYVAALVLLMIFAFWLDGTIFELPLGNMTSRNYDTFSPPGKLLDVLWHLALPMVCFTYGSLAYESRFVKSNMEEVLRQDYIRTARAKGAGPYTVVVKHAFRNTLIPLVTLIGLTLARRAQRRGDPGADLHLAWHGATVFSGHLVTRLSDDHGRDAALRFADADRPVARRLPVCRRRSARHLLVSPFHCQPS